MRSYINKVLITKGLCCSGLDLSDPIWSTSGLDRNRPRCWSGSGPLLTRTEQNPADKTRPLGMQNNITHRGKRGKESSQHLPLDTAGEPSRSSEPACDWQARGEGFQQGCGVHIRTYLRSITMLWALKGQIERTGALASANLVGRWLTSPCPSKRDLGRTFNEIHSTWRAPPLPGLSV